MKQQIKIVTFLLCFVASVHASDVKDRLAKLKKQSAELKKSFELTKILQAPVCDCCCKDCGIRNVDVVDCINCASVWSTGVLMHYLSADAHPFTQLFNTLAGCSAGSYAIAPMLQEWYIAWQLASKKGTALIMSEDDHDKQE